jgi:hypothetical protein
MFTKFGFRNLGREVCFGKNMAAYRFKAEGDITAFIY